MYQLQEESWVIISRNVVVYHCRAYVRLNLPWFQHWLPAISLTFFSHTILDKLPITLKLSSPTFSGLVAKAQRVFVQNSTHQSAPSTE